ncbi:MAG: glutamate synthase, partial [Candidatus Eisenbacteria bacterium]
ADAGWEVRTAGLLRLDQRHQIATFADFCNECGNCDVFCPEDGGPYVLKPRFFGSREEWERHAALDGFFVRLDSSAGAAGETEVYGRVDGKQFHLRVEGDKASFSGDGFALELDRKAPSVRPRGRADGVVDLTYYHILELVLEAIVTSGDVNYVSV